MQLHSPTSNAVKVSPPPSPPVDDFFLLLRVMVVVECPICMEDFVHVETLRGCGHTMCTTCTWHAVVTRGMACSLCRQVVCGVEDDMGGVMLALTHGRHAGVTLKNHARGVMVVGLTPCDEARRHFKVGDVFTRIGGLPAVHHRDAILQINEATRSSIPLRISSTRSHQVSNLKELRRRAIAFHCTRDEWTSGHTSLA